MCRFKSSLPARGAGPFPASAEANGAARAQRPLREPAPARAASPAGRGGARGKPARPAEPGGQRKAGRERSSLGERPEPPRCLLAPSEATWRRGREAWSRERARRRRWSLAEAARPVCPAGPAAPPPSPPWRLGGPLCSPLLLLLSPAVARPPDLVRSSLLYWKLGPPGHRRRPSPGTRRNPDFPPPWIEPIAELG